MKTKTIGIACVVLFGVMLASGFLYAFVQAMPKKLTTPERWDEEANSTGVVSRVSTAGIEVRFSDGKKGFFGGEQGYTNGQPVLAHVTVHYIRNYDIPGRGAVEWYERSVRPLADNVSR